LCRRLGAHQGRSELRHKIFPSPGFDPPTVQPVASRYNNYSILAHKIEKCKNKDAMYQTNNPTRKNLVKSEERRKKEETAKETAIHCYAVPKTILTILESSWPS
jgi:hypothetical protein